MAGIYIHIPFCKQACHYCDFHFSTSSKYQTEMVQAICKELVLRKQELTPALQSIYFGGGTPSILTLHQLNFILETIHKHYDCSSIQEITLEANPDDLNLAYLTSLRQTKINRLSIGIQSFFDNDLQWMNRSHSASQAKQCILQAQDLGFNNLSIDLIYGSPTTTQHQWEQNLQIYQSLQLSHLSAYCLTVEQNTALHHHIKQNKSKPVSEEQGQSQFETLIQFAQEHHMQHYEISNFCKSSQFAVHNTNYWFNKPYLGIGPSAHSYNGKQRQWNIRNNIQYIKAIEANTIPAEIEELTISNKINEYVLTRLRTMWGINQEEFCELFGDVYWQQIYKDIKKELLKGNIIQQNQTYTLTQEGKFFADHIASHCFI